MLSKVRRIKVRKLVWEEPEIDPAGNKDGGNIVTVVDHVGCHEHPLGQVQDRVATPVIRQFMGMCFPLVSCEELGVPR